MIGSVKGVAIGCLISAVLDLEQELHTGCVKLKGARAGLLDDSILRGGSSY